MPTRESLTTDEWYHIYNRGVDKREVFLNERDYEKFLVLMYFATCAKSITIHATNFRKRKLSEILLDQTINIGLPIVDIGAYCLLSNHIHFAIKANVENGISLFMQRLFTGYTMYFNIKGNRTGSLFAGSFKSKHIADDRYLKHLVSYIHLNPAELIDSAWKVAKADIHKIEKEIIHYRYSSLPDFLSTDRPESKLIAPSIFELYDEKPTLKKMIIDAHEYYESLGEQEIKDFDSQG